MRELRLNNNLLILLLTIRNFYKRIRIKMMKDVLGTNGNKGENLESAIVFPQIPWPSDWSARTCRDRRLRLQYLHYYGNNLHLHLAEQLSFCTIQSFPRWKSNQMRSEQIHETMTWNWGISYISNSSHENVLILRDSLREIYCFEIGLQINSTFRKKTKLP